MATSGSPPEIDLEAPLEAQVDGLSLCRAALEVPQRLALVTAGETWTFAQLWRRVAEEMAFLIDHGVTPGRPLALVGGNDLATLVRIYAALEMGLPLALLHDRATVEEHRHWVDAWGAQEPVARGGESTLSTATPCTATPALDGILAIVRTSGSGGLPKGVRLSRRAFVASALASAANLGWQDEDRWLLALPVAHVGGLAILVRCLLGRRTLAIDGAADGVRRFDAGAMVELLERQGITLLSVVPTMLDALMGATPQAPPKLRAVLVGGAAAAPQLMRRAVEQGWPVLATYGCSEAGSQITTQTYGTPWTPAVGSGRPLRDQRVRIRQGRIETQGPTLMDGYLPPGDEPFTEDGWLRTGDLGRLAEDGQLHVLGRADEVIISGGENVSPLTVEAVLASHPAVTAACVFGRDDAKWGQRVVAALVAKEGVAKPAAKAWDDFLRERLAPYERPKEVVWVESLLLNAVGKVDRRATAELASERAAEPMLDQLKDGTD